VDGIARTLLRMGRPVGRVSLRAFKADVVRIRDAYLLSNLADINVSQFVQEVMDAAQQHRIRLNPTYAVLTKTAMTIEGIMRFLEPDLDVIAVAGPYVKMLAARRFSARKIGASALRTSMALSGFLTQLPDQMDQVLMDLEGGNLTISMRNDELESLGQHLNTLGTRIFLGIIASGLAVSAAIMLQSHDYVIHGVSVRLLVGLLCAANATILFWWSLGWHIFGGKSSIKLRLSPLMRLLRRD
jgi:ubiquinone biosynthesis protein